MSYTEYVAECALDSPVGVGDVGSASGDAPFDGAPVATYTGSTATDLPPVFTSTDWTVEFWAKTPTLYANNCAFSMQGSGSTNNNGLFYVGESVAGVPTVRLWFMGSTPLEYEDDALVTDWHHYVFERDGWTLNLYIDGVLVDTGSPSSVFTPTNHFIGGNNTFAQYFNGMLSCFRTYDTVLGQTRVQAHYDAAMTGETAPGPIDIDAVPAQRTLTAPAPHVNDPDAPDLSVAPVMEYGSRLRLEVAGAFPEAAELGPNLFSDPSFESSLSTFDSNGNVTRSTEQVHSGTYAARLQASSTGTSASLTEAVSGLQANSRYIFSAWVYTASGTNSRLRVSGETNAVYYLPGQTDHQTTDSRVGVWRQLVIPFETNQGGIVTFQLLSASAADSVTYVDDIALHQVVGENRPSYNIISNPSGEFQASGWTVTNANLTGAKLAEGPIHVLQYVAAGASMVSAREQLGGGDYLGIGWTEVPWTTPANYTVTPEFFDIDGNQITFSQTPVVTWNAGTSGAHRRRNLYPIHMPANAYSVRLRINLTSGGYLRFYDVVMAQGDTPQAAAFVDEPEGFWEDIIGPTYEVKVHREELNVGTLDAFVKDSALDPAKGSILTPGREVRLLALSSTDEWEALFTGRINKAESKYVQQPGGAVQTRISLYATDAVAELAAEQESRGTFEIGSLVQGVPMQVNGADPTIVNINDLLSVNENASLLDQIVITRDSKMGFAWVNRENWLIYYDPDQMPTALASTLSEEDYSDLDIGYSQQWVINEVMVRVLSTTEGSEEVVHGPYRDISSIRQWGRRNTEFTVHGVDPDPIAQNALERNADARVLINSMVVPIRYVADLASDKALLDLYDKVRLMHTESTTDVLTRVTVIEHEITPRSWQMSLQFSPEESVAYPQVVPPR